MRARTAPVKDGPRANEEIEADEVQLIDETGENQGTVSLEAALEMAAE